MSPDFLLIISDWTCFSQNTEWIGFCGFKNVLWRFWAGRGTWREREIVSNTVNLGNRGLLFSPQRVTGEENSSNWNEKVWWAAGKCTLFKTFYGEISLSFISFSSFFVIILFSFEINIKYISTIFIQFSL